MSAAPWAFVIPAVIAVLALRYFPIIVGGAYSFTDWKGNGLHANWVGLGNFRRIFHDHAARYAIVHTLQLAALFVICVNVVGLLLALGLRRAVKTRSVLMAVFFLPVVLSELATSYVWQYIFTYDGPLNLLLGRVGLDSWKRAWTADPDWAIYTILVVMIWQFAGLTMVIYLAGLSGISDELEDAAAVDGAPPLMKFRRVTLPLLAPAMTVAVTLTMIFGLRVFDQVLGITGGGPVDATETLATQVYKQTFNFGLFGYGAAIALVMTVIVAVLTVVVTALLRMREAY
jgi:raffinose/stachyose/melibiose transport system permease protein